MNTFTTYRKQENSRLHLISKILHALTQRLILGSNRLSLKYQTQHFSICESLTGRRSFTMRLVKYHNRHSANSHHRKPDAVFSSAECAHVTSTPGATSWSRKGLGPDLIIYLVFFSSRSDEVVHPSAVWPSSQVQLPRNPQPGRTTPKNKLNRLLFILSAIGKGKTILSY